MLPTDSVEEMVRKRSFSSDEEILQQPVDPPVLAEVATQVLASSSRDASSSYQIPPLTFIPSPRAQDSVSAYFHDRGLKKSFPFGHMLSGLNSNRRGDHSPRIRQTVERDRINRGAESPACSSSRTEAAARASIEEMPLISSSKAYLYNRKLVGELSERVNREAENVRANPGLGHQRMIGSAMESAMSQVREFERIELKEMLLLLPHMTKTVLQKAEGDKRIWIDLDIAVNRIIKHLELLLLEKKRRSPFSEQLLKWADEAAALFRSETFSFKSVSLWFSKALECEYYMDILKAALSKDAGEAADYISEMCRWTGFSGRVLIEQYLMEEIRKTLLIVEIAERKFIWQDEGNLERLLEAIDMEQVERSITVDNGTFLPEKFVINGRDFVVPPACKTAKETKTVFFESILSWIYLGGLFAASSPEVISAEAAKFFQREGFIGYDLLRLTSISAWSHFDRALRALYPALFSTPYSTRSVSGLSVFINVISPKQYEVAMQKTYRIYPLLNPGERGSFAIDQERPLVEITVKGHVMTDTARDESLKRSCMLEFPKILFLKSSDVSSRSRLMEILGHPALDKPFTPDLPTDPSLLTMLETFRQEINP